MSLLRAPETRTLPQLMRDIFVLPAQQLVSALAELQTQSLLKGIPVPPLVSWVAREEWTQLMREGLAYSFATQNLAAGGAGVHAVGLIFNPLNSGIRLLVKAAWLVSTAIAVPELRWLTADPGLAVIGPPGATNMKLDGLANNSTQEAVNTVATATKALWTPIEIGNVGAGQRYDFLAGQDGHYIADVYAGAGLAIVNGTVNSPASLGFLFAEVPDGTRPDVAGFSNPYP